MQDRLRIDKHGWCVGETTLSVPKRVSGSIHRLDVFWQRLKLNPRAVDSKTNSDPVVERKGTDTLNYFKSNTGTVVMISLVFRVCLTSILALNSSLDHN